MIRRTGTLALALVLAACAGRAPPPPAGSGPTLWPKHRAAAERVVRWSIEGRVSVRGPQDSGSATLHWQESPESAELRASGPLGAGSFVLTRDASGARLRTGDGTERRAAEIASLVQGAFGGQIPVDALAYWIRGLPAPAPSQAVEIDPYGRLARLRQQGWDVEFSGYAPAEGVDLPTRLRARSEDWEVRLAIRRWRVDAAV